MDGGGTNSIDADVVDAGSATADSGSGDGSGPDAGSMDAESSDAGSSDSSLGDAAPNDAATPNDAAPDAAAPSDAAPDDAAANDAAPNDAALSDAAVGDGGPTNFCPDGSAALFCDGFEDPTFSRWSFKVLSNGTLTRSTTRSRTGAGSLRATTGAASAGTAARYATEVLARQMSGEIWLRYYYYLPSSTLVNTFFSAGVVSEISPPYDGFALIVHATRVDIAALGITYTGTLQFPRDRWTCVELHVQIDPTAGIYEAYLDGMLAVRSSPTDTLPADGYTSAEVGVHYADVAQGPLDVYVDDVVVANTRIACD